MLVLRIWPILKSTLGAIEPIKTIETFWATTLLSPTFGQALLAKLFSELGAFGPFVGAPAFPTLAIALTLALPLGSLAFALESSNDSIQ